MAPQGVTRDAGQVHFSSRGADRVARCAECVPRHCQRRARRSMNGSARECFLPSRSQRVAGHEERRSKHMESGKNELAGRLSGGSESRSSKSEPPAKHGERKDELTERMSERSESRSSTSRPREEDRERKNGLAQRLSARPGNRSSMSQPPDEHRTRINGLAEPLSPTRGRLAALVGIRNEDGGAKRPLPAGPSLFLGRRAGRPRILCGSDGRVEG
jgi:hypothetical protein